LRWFVSRLVMERRGVSRDRISEQPRDRSGQLLARSAPGREKSATFRVVLAGRK